ncbi:PAS domain-containing protein [Tranquillimonas alkanivorans]|uniref:histidine kinase n=1 Tax=Tranquillimonas alkanivorans TaxID=441119 RepID=A0A1I5RYR6_9RHOB|nr:PAS domain-containing protein [Tranquillimonas alkanivorans]SFP63136.1 hypothetical protein SAMN04488047_109139 [Tranquillimonas alkanivorans]
MKVTHGIVAPRVWLPVSAALWLAAALLETLTPLGVTHGSLYLFPLMAVAASGQRTPVIVVAALSAVATAAGFLVHEHGVSRSLELLDRAITITLLGAFSVMALTLQEALARARRGEAAAQRSIEALARAEATLQHAEGTGPIGSLHLDLASGELRWSDGLFRIFGLESGGCLSMADVTARLHPGDRAGFDNALSDALDRGERLEHEHRIVRAGDGAVRRVALIAEKVEGEGGAYLAGVVQDVTDQRVRERRLRLLSSAVAMLDEIVLITEADSLDSPEGPRIVYVNDAFERITGYTREQALGQTPRMLQGPCTQRAELDRLRAALEKAEPVSVELINYRADGEEYWLEISVSPVRDERGRLTHFVAVQRDVTRRKKNLEALREVEERYRLVTQATSDVVWDWDMQTGGMWYSDSVLAMLGTRIDSLDAWLARVHPDDRAHVEATNARMLEGADTVVEDEYRLRRADGTYIRVKDRAFVQRDAAGRPLRMLGTMQDVTEAREMEARLSRAETLQAVGTLTGGVAHDINNLMTVVLGNADLLDEELEAQPGARAKVDQIAGAAERAAALTGRLLAFAREQPLEPRSVDVPALVEQLLPILRTSLPDSVSLRVQALPGLPPAHVDPGQLEVALLNLVVNARDAMPRGGVIDIGITFDRPDGRSDPLDGRPLPDECLIVSVKDHGTGMTPEVLSKALDPFFTTKPPGAGTGLGLSMAYGFAKQSGGHIELSSTPRQGTTVRIFLPAASVPAIARAARPDAPAAGGGEHVLLVEDDRDVRAATERQLAALGYRVSSAEDAAEAMAALEAHPDVALLLTDLVLSGGMNGRELAERAREENPDLRVLYASGYAEAQVLAHDRPDPQVPLLRKPFRRAALAAAVGGALAGQSSSTETVRK